MQLVTSRTLVRDQDPSVLNVEKNKTKATLKTEGEKKIDGKKFLCKQKWTLGFHYPTVPLPERKEVSPALPRWIHWEFTLPSAAVAPTRQWLPFPPCTQLWPLHCPPSCQWLLKQARNEPPAWGTKTWNFSTKIQNPFPFLGLLWVSPSLMHSCMNADTRDEVPEDKNEWLGTGRLSLSLSRMLRVPGKLQIPCSPASVSTISRKKYNHVCGSQEEAHWPCSSLRLSLLLGNTVTCCLRSGGTDGWMDTMHGAEIIFPWILTPLWFVRPCYCIESYNISGWNGPRGDHWVQLLSLRRPTQKIRPYD